MKTLDDQLEEIMYRFDWARVVQVMQMLNWRWATVPNYSVPALEDLQRTARAMLDDVVEHYTQTGEWTYRKTGGLAARLYTSNYGPYLELSFEVTDCCVAD